ncbi:glycine/betaine ABC transporter ATP-binding protein, partial [Streptomyces sp. NPDC127574]
DVPREQVMTVRTAMRPGACGATEHPDALAPGTVVHDAIRTVSGSGRAACVVQDGRCLGVVDHERLLAVVAGADLNADEDARTGADPRGGADLRKEAV